MPLSSIQKNFVHTVRQLGFRESSVFEIGYDEAVRVIANQTLYRHRNVDQIVINVLGWLKYYDRRHPEYHQKISTLIRNTFGFMRQIAFEEGYIGVDRLLPLNYLFRAIESGNVEDVLFVLEHEDFDPNAPRDRDGETPLTLACQIGNAEVVRALLKDPRVDPNQFDSGWMQFPLHNAVNNGYADIVRELLKHPDIDPNQQRGPAYAAVILAIFYGYQEILEMLSDHPKTNLHFVRSRQQVTPIHDLISFGSPALKTMGVKIYPINPEQKDTEIVPWTMFSVIPVSCDQSHKPPANYFEGLTIVDLKCFRNESGDLEFHHDKNWTRVVYRTDQYITVSLLYQNRPFGPTIYKPLCCHELEIRESSHIWHIADRSIANNPKAILQILSELAEKGFIVLRSMNRDNDVPRLLKNESLEGRKDSTDVAVQVRGDDTALISASTQPISKFLRAHKGRQNGGYAALFTPAGAYRYLNYQGPYPKILSHSEVLKHVSHDATLTERAVLAKECIIYPGLSPEFVVWIQGGYPTLSGRKRKKGKNTNPLPRDVKKYLDSQNLSYDELPEDLQMLLHSNKKLNIKKRVVSDYLNNKS